MYPQHQHRHFSFSNSVSNTPKIQVQTNPIFIIAHSGSFLQNASSNKPIFFNSIYQFIFTKWTTLILATIGPFCKSDLTWVGKMLGTRSATPWCRAMMWCDYDNFFNINSVWENHNYISIPLSIRTCFFNDSSHFLFHNNPKNIVDKGNFKYIYIMEVVILKLF